MTIQREIQHHVKRNCATYAGDGRCLLDRPCPFFDEEKEGARCIYFENAVIPDDDKLKTRYWARFDMSYWDENVKTCAECKHGFTTKSNAQKYCNDCSSEVKRRQKSAQNKEYYRRQKE